MMMLLPVRVKLGVVVEEKNDQMVVVGPRVKTWKRKKKMKWHEI